MIPDEEVDSALAWLVKNADKAAAAKAHRVMLEESCRCLKSKLMKESGESSISAQERDALASEAYSVHLEGLKAAVFEEEKYRLLRAAAEARIECWRTYSSNQRAQGKI